MPNFRNRAFSLKHLGTQIPDAKCLIDGSGGLFSGRPVNAVGPADPMVSSKIREVRHWSQGVRDWGYVIGDKPLPGIKNQTNYFFPAQQPNYICKTPKGP